MTIQKCTWCNKDLNLDKPVYDKYSNSELPLYYGLCEDCQSKLGDEIFEDISEVDRSIIDNLPYGLILLDKSGAVTLYNQTESNFTGFSISKVEGKNFFEEVAPCTAVKEFQGEFDELIKNAVDDQREIDFEFKHQRFQAQVKILMTYFSLSDIVSLTVAKKDTKPLIESS